jgi:hypothetical protein
MGRSIYHARPRNSRQSPEYLRVKRIKRVQQSAYHPDIAPHAFLLFGGLEQKLTKDDIPEGESFTNAIPRLFDKIGQEILTTVSEAWMNRLNCVIEPKGEYFTESLRNEKKSWQF